VPIVPLKQGDATADNPRRSADHVVAGSDNKEIYEVAAQGHVRCVCEFWRAAPVLKADLVVSLHCRSAMEGYNSVVFAYGQTA
jgi:hypothetical protein